ncbi:clathrin associated protein complex medium subunit [Malassezia sp. CBS 17886]|nr:clathrin associated protein complex medium subunit [Malassezia sp. CBS 17886]
MISGFFVLNIRGDVLISRLFRHDLKRGVTDLFRIHVVHNPEVTVPMVTLGGTTFFWVAGVGVYVMAATRSNANPTLVFEFLYRFLSLGESYLGGALTEVLVKENFTLIYELLDEALDFGYPQTSDVGTLKMFTNEGVAAGRDHGETGVSSSRQTSRVRTDIKYRKNEVFLDVIETVNVLISGHVLRADVNGRIVMRAFLSGVPECKVGLNNDLSLDTHTGQHARSARAAGAAAVSLSDCTFHQCVRLDEFDRDQSIQFVPPDGEFELMRYRTSSNIRLPFRVQAMVDELPHRHMQYTVHIRAAVDEHLQATNVVLRIPTPHHATGARCHAPTGKAKYEPENHCIVWRIAKMQGGSEFSLVADADVSAGIQATLWSRPPIEVDFTVLMFAASGLVVRYLKVSEKSNYPNVKWVRYMTRATGSYLVRF